MSDCAQPAVPPFLSFTETIKLFDPARDIGRPQERIFELDLMIRPFVALIFQQNHTF